MKLHFLMKSSQNFTIDCESEEDFKIYEAIMRNPEIEDISVGNRLWCRKSEIELFYMEILNKPQEVVLTPDLVETLLS